MLMSDPAHNGQKGGLLDTFHPNGRHLGHIVEGEGLLQKKKKKKKMSDVDISGKRLTGVFDLTQYYTVKIHALHK